MKPWTTKEIQYLEKNALLAETNEVLNISDMAKKLSRTTQSVRNKIYYMQRAGDLPAVEREKAFDSKGRPWSENEEKRLIAMHNQGEAYSAIADALGRSVASCTSKVSKLINKGKIKKTKVAKWDRESVMALVRNVRFDENGYVENYDELVHLLGKGYEQVQAKVARLRKNGSIDIHADRTTTSVKAKQAMNRFNNARFANLPRKEDSSMKQPTQSEEGIVDIQSKQVTLILTSIIIDGQRTDQYFLPNGQLIAVKKEPTSSANEVSQ